MSTRIHLTAHRASAVYDDRWRLILDALGPIRITRASEVEYDSATGEWFAILLATGQEIARGKNRQQVIVEEVKFLETRSI